MSVPTLDFDDPGFMAIVRDTFQNALAHHPDNPQDIEITGGLMVGPNGERVRPALGGNGYEAGLSLYWYSPTIAPTYGETNPFVRWTVPGEPFLPFRELAVFMAGALFLGVLLELEGRVKSCCPAKEGS